MKTRIIRLITLCFAFITIFLSSCQKRSLTDTPLPSTLVPKDVAKEIAVKFNAGKFQNDDPSVKNALIKPTTLKGNNSIVSDIVIYDKNKQPALYVFNFDHNQGFVIVSADYELRPILGYIDNGVYSDQNMPDGLKDWTNRTIENVEVVRAGLYDNTKEASLAWNRYMKENDVDKSTLSKYPPVEPDPCNPVPPPYTYTVGPLLPVTWGQTCTYNDLCDLTHNYGCFGCNSRPATGCVATSMSMVFRYHQFPAAYAWGNMPATFGNGDVQQLMSDAGVSVGMSYGCSSGAYGSVVPNAIKYGFGYSSANRWSYSSTSYNNGYGRVKDNVMSNHWPVILQGEDANVGGHQWVCDGGQETTYYICENGTYSITYLMFHMNWGWHEAGGGTDYNGWFAFDNWNIWGLNWNFQYNRYGITEIHP